jgi:hypothetical protein
MSARSASETPLPVAWPLAGSLILTTAVVALVCTPPPSPLHSWVQIFSRATLYLLMAGSVHALAVWGVCRVRDESEDAGLPLIWGLIWTAWITVVWLPLVALLTAEHSPWVALVLPLTVVFATLLLKWHSTQAEVEDDFSFRYALPSTRFQLLQSPPLWRLLLPAAVTSIAAELGITLLAAGHSWEAGCLFGVGIVYPVSRWLDRRAAPGGKPGGRAWGRTAAGNSLTVWLLLVLALVPLMASYAARKLSGVLGIDTRIRSSFTPPAIVHRKSSGYDSVILLQPKKPHEFIAPAASAMSGAVPKDAGLIPFDGAYWYFKEPATQPAPDAHVMRGDPVKKRMLSTDHQPLVMEAHQPLDREIALSCCRSLRVDVKNADNVPGSIAVEVLLRDRLASKKTLAVSLGTVVLPSSTVSPMPLQRPPVDDKVTFHLPHAARIKTFNEITVRIKPESSRSLAGAKVGIKDFVLQP